MIPAPAAVEKNTKNAVDAMRRQHTFLGKGYSPRAGKCNQGKTEAAFPPGDGFSGSLRW